jgi:transcriptional regulator of met regulon
MRDKKFYIRAVKMDLLRTTRVVANLKHSINENTAKEFLLHALKDLEKNKLSPREKELKQELVKLSRSISNVLNDPHKRLRWAEKVLTVSCRL